MITTVIFDFDGVLVESVDLKARAFASLFEKEAPEIVSQIVNYRLDNGGISRYEKFKYTFEHFLQRPLSEQKLAELGEKFSRLVIPEVIRAPWVRGAREFLEAFHGTLDLYVATATPQEEIARIVHCRKMGHFFKNVVGSPPGKGDAVLNIVKNGEYEPHEVAMVGDSINDYEVAKAAGIHFIGRVSSLASPLNRQDSIAKIPDLDSLAQILGLRPGAESSTQLERIVGREGRGAQREASSQFPARGPEKEDHHRFYCS